MLKTVILNLLLVLVYLWVHDLPTNTRSCQYILSIKQNSTKAICYVLTILLIAPLLISRHIILGTLLPVAPGGPLKPAGPGIP